MWKLKELEDRMQSFIARVTNTECIVAPGLGYKARTYLTSRKKHKKIPKLGEHCASSELREPPMARQPTPEQRGLDFIDGKDRIVKAAV